MYNIKKINKNGPLTTTITVFQLKHLFEKMLLFFSKNKMEKHLTFLRSEGKTAVCGFKSLYGFSWNSLTLIVFDQGGFHQSAKEVDRHQTSNLSPLSHILNLSSRALEFL